MAKMLTASAAVIGTLALIGAWTAAPMNAHVNNAAVAVDVMQLTLQAKDLPAQEFPAF